MGTVIRSKMLRLALVVVALVVMVTVAKKSAPGEKPSWANKDISFYTEADMERLLDQWEVHIIIIIALENDLGKFMLVK